MSSFVHKVVDQPDEYIPDPGGGGDTVTMPARTIRANLENVEALASNANAAEIRSFLSVQAGATDDQTGAEIVAAVQAAGPIGGGDPWVTKTAYDVAIMSLQSTMQSIGGVVDGQTSTVNGHTGQLSSLSGSISSLASQVSSLQTQIENGDFGDLTEIENSITSLQGTVSAHTTQLASLQGQITSVNVSFGTLTDTVNAFGDTVTALNTTVSTLATNVSTNATGLTAANTAIADLEDAVEILQNVGGGDNATAIAANAAAITALQTAVATKAATADLTALTTTVSGKASQSALDTLTSTVATKASQSALDTLATTVNGKASSASLTTLEGRVTAAETDINNVESSVSTLSGTVSGHTTTIGTQGTAITALETSVAAKASQADLTALTTTVGTKANSSTVTTLSDTVTGLETELGTKLDDAEFTSVAVRDKIVGMTDEDAATAAQKLFAQIAQLPAVMTFKDYLDGASENKYVTAAFEARLATPQTITYGATVLLDYGDAAGADPDLGKFRSKQANIACTGDCAVSIIGVRGPLVGAQSIIHFTNSGGGARNVSVVTGAGITVSHALGVVNPGLGSAANDWLGVCLWYRTATHVVVMGYIAPSV